MSDPQGLTDRLEALAEQHAGLCQAVDRNDQRVDGLREDFGRLADRQTRAEDRIVWTAVFTLVAFLLATGVTITALRGEATDRRLDKLCPVLALLVGGYDPNTRPPGEARAKYDDSFGVMRQSYRDLACTQPLVPPRKGN